VHELFSHVSTGVCLSRQTIYRIKDDPAATETALSRFGGYDDRASSHRSREEHASPADHEIAVTAGVGFASVNIADVTLSRASRVTPAVTAAYQSRN